MTAPIYLDHVALASQHAWENVYRYCYHLGGEWRGGPAIDEGADDHDDQFYFAQVGFANDTTLELLEPLPTTGSAFLQRFLDRNGPGPHHLTYKVDDFDRTLDEVAAGGHELVGVDRSQPTWQQAFLHPKASHGIVIQLAHQGQAPEAEPAADQDPEGEGGSGWPNETQLPPSSQPRAALTLVEHLVADLDGAVKLFAGPLGMTELDPGSEAVDHGLGPSATLGCGPWRLRLVQPSDPGAQHWLGSRPGRLHQLHFELDEPAVVPGALPRGDGTYELAPERNLGTRLHLSGPRQP